MKSSILALVLAAGLSVPAFAQQASPAGADHNAHHPQQAQAQTTAPMGTPQAPTGTMSMPQAPMPGMQAGTPGQGAQRPGGMMNCPMMQGAWPA
ncbi:hypothetical protein ACFOYU_05820 [Microvirga sp. GCM10011540]|uniref:hypothetical protein n=1 Tax=Microvirga sp. GCM10011540 TaxID=3317338 RepID=UPI00360EB646